MLRISVAGMLAMLLACDPGGNRPVAPAALPSIDKIIQFGDGTTAQLTLKPVGQRLHGSLTSGGDVELNLHEEPGGSGLLLSTNLCTSDFLVRIFGYPDAVTGMVDTDGITESFSDPVAPMKAHPVAGTWAVSATYAASATEMVFVSGELPMRGHGDLLFSHLSYYAWDSTTYVAAAINGIGPVIDCMTVSVLRDRAVSVFSVQFLFAEDFTNAVVWSGDVTGTAVKIPE